MIPEFMTPAFLVSLSRIVLSGGACILAVLLLGPFQGLERAIGLSDIAAHATAFYAGTLAILAAAPRWRRGDLTLIILSAAILSEIAQAFTGRSASFGDLLADVAGMTAALAPWFVDELRRHARRNPDVSIATLLHADRRRREKKRTDATRPVAWPAAASNQPG